ncbi:MAG: NADH-quinone oxidoreductase subunit J, partial [Myxococcales bacterium]|nr:NADH-quinone oxidoreductase subunit J [Myxococcales bacterium]
MSTPNLILFWVCAAMALFGAAGTALAARPLRAAVSLLLHIVALAGLYLTLHAQLLAAMQLLVYAGAIVVLFVFVIMMIGPATAVTPTSRGLMPRMISVVLMGSVIATIGAALVQYSVPYVGLPADYGTVDGLGTAIYGGAAIPFELVSITLLVAIVGAVAVARGRSKAEAEAIAQRRAEREASDERTREH